MKFEIKLDNGEKVKVNYNPDAFATVSHFEFYGLAISETGYRSHFSTASETVTVPIIKKYAKEVAEEFAKKVLETKNKKSRKRKKL